MVKFNQFNEQSNDCRKAANERHCLKGVSYSRNTGSRERHQKSEGNSQSANCINGRATATRKPANEKIIPRKKHSKSKYRK